MFRRQRIDLARPSLVRRPTAFQRREQSGASRAPAAKQTKPLAGEIIARRRPTTSGRGKWALAFIASIPSGSKADGHANWPRGRRNSTLLIDSAAAGRHAAAQEASERARDDTQTSRRLAEAACRVQFARRGKQRDSQSCVSPTGVTVRRQFEVGRGGRRIKLYGANNNAAAAAAAAASANGNKMQIVRAARNLQLAVGSNAISNCQPLAGGRPIELHCAPPPRLALRARENLRQVNNGRGGAAASWLLILSRRPIVRRGRPAAARNDSIWNAALANKKAAAAALGFLIAAGGRCAERRAATSAPKKRSDATRRAPI